MASKVASTALLLLCLNIVFFTLISATSCPPKTPKPAPATPKPAPMTPKPFTCPKDTLKFGVCVDVLNGIVSGVVGTPLGSSSSCCNLIKNLADAEAALCLCTAIKAKVLGVNLDAPVCVTVLLNNCGKKVPKGFHCP